MASRSRALSAASARTCCSAACSMLRSAPSASRRPCNTVTMSSPVAAVAMLNTNAVVLGESPPAGLQWTRWLRQERPPGHGRW